MTSILIDFQHLESEIESLRIAYAENTPWPHVVIDNFLDPVVAEMASDLFPIPEPARAALARAFGARSYRGQLDNVAPHIVEILNGLHSERFTSIVERITDIVGLEADAKMIGSGIHQGFRGSYLRVHADHNAHPQNMHRFRRVNVILYLNRHWRPEWNGDLELWDRTAMRCEKALKPAFNRCVIMKVDDTAYHGHGRLRLPAGEARKALVSYFYSDRPADGQATDSHPSIFPALAGEGPLPAMRARLDRALWTRIQRYFHIPQ